MVNMSVLPKVSIIILCNNSRQWLKTCIESVIMTDYDNYDVVLVDNASTDGSIEELQCKYNNLIIIRNTQNLGWCKGNNIGIKYALEHGASYIYLSNSDVRFFDPCWLKELISFVIKRPEYQIVGPLQYEYNDETTINSWTEYILWNGNRDVHHMWSKYIKSDFKKYGYSLDNNSESVLDVAFVQGAAMLISKDAFRQLGFFDDLYFIFFDEVDFCRRNLRIGNRVAIVPTSKVQHYGSGDNSSSSERQKKRNYYYSRNKYYYVISDYNTRTSIKIDIILTWLKRDIKQCVQRNSDISGIGQLIQIMLDVLLSLRTLKKKRKYEKALEKRIIANILVDLISPIVPGFTIEQMNCDLQNTYLISSTDILTLCNAIKTKFGVKVVPKFLSKSQVIPAKIVDYILQYELWRRNI